MMVGVMVLDLQYGSTGKGLLCGYIGKRLQPDTIVTAWAANAGHTFIDEDGTKYVHTMVGNGIVSPELRRLLIGPGSIINQANLATELEAVFRRPDAGEITIAIHENAAVISGDHVTKEEVSMTAIGSTKKGVGACLAHKIRRPIKGAPVAKDALIGKLRDFIVTDAQYSSLMNEAKVLLVEGAQGYSLSLNHGFYPYVTSRNVTPSQVVSDCGIPWHMATKLRIMGTLRTYPIRVANRFDTHGNMVGTSGPCYEDQKEILWGDIGVEPELTTVTKLPRRIFTFSDQQLSEALNMCRPHALFLNFVNYLEPDQVEPFIDRVNTIAARYGSKIALIGRGPTVNDLEELRWDQPEDSLAGK